MTQKISNETKRAKQLVWSFNNFKKQHEAEVKDKDDKFLRIGLSMNSDKLKDINIDILIKELKKLKFDAKVSELDGREAFLYNPEELTKYLD